MDPIYEEVMDTVPGQGDVIIFRPIRDTQGKIKKIEK